MNEYQKEAYRNDALELKDQLRDKGYLPSDIAAVAYFLLESNIGKAEELEKSIKNTQDVLKRAEQLLNQAPLDEKDELDKTSLENQLLLMWKHADIETIYKYKNRINILPEGEGRAHIELMYDLTHSLFEELEDIANYRAMYPSDCNMTIDQLISNRSK